MATPLTQAQEEEYRRIIDGILAAADLSTVSVKKVRKGLEAALGGQDLSEQKYAIKSLIEARFDAISADAPTAAGAMPTPPSAPSTGLAESIRPHHGREANGHSPEERERDEHDDEDDDAADANGEIQVSLPVPILKKRKHEDNEDADAKLAARLQAEENQRARGRTTRGATGGGAKVLKKKKTGNNKAKRLKKSDKKVREEDDSDVANSDEDGDSGSQSKRKAGGGFQKPFNLSFPLAALVGETQLSRPQVVKKLWEHIKALDLQDPTDKRQILCDEKMQAVFKQSKVSMFQMNKLLGSHLYPLDEEE